MTRSRNIPGNIPSLFVFGNIFVHAGYNILLVLIPVLRSVILVLTIVLFNAIRHQNSGAKEKIWSKKYYKVKYYQVKINHGGHFLE